ACIPQCEQKTCCATTVSKVYTVSASCPSATRNHPPQSGDGEYLLCAYRAVALGQQIQVDACLEAHPAAMAATLALLQHRHTPSVPARSHRSLAYRLVSIIVGRGWVLRQSPAVQAARVCGSFEPGGNRTAETGDAGGISRCRQHGPADGRQTHGCGP